MQKASRPLSRFAPGNQLVINSQSPSLSLWVSWRHCGGLLGCIIKMMGVPTFLTPTSNMPEKKKRELRRMAFETYKKAVYSLLASCTAHMTFSQAHHCGSSRVFIRCHLTLYRVVWDMAFWRDIRCNESEFCIDFIRWPNQWQKWNQCKVLILLQRISRQMATTHTTLTFQI